MGEANGTGLVGDADEECIHTLLVVGTRGDAGKQAHLERLEQTGDDQSLHGKIQQYLHANVPTFTEEEVGDGRKLDGCLKRLVSFYGGHYFDDEKRCCPGKEGYYGKGKYGTVREVR